MQKFIFVITSILILSLVACNSSSNSLVGQGVGGSDDDRDDSSGVTDDVIPEMEIKTSEHGRLKLQYADLDQYNKQLRDDIEQMQKDIQQEQMINNLLQKDITNLSNELQSYDQQFSDNQSASPTVEELIEAEIITIYIKSSLIEIYKNSQGDQVKFMAEADKLIAEVNNIILGGADVNSLGKQIED